MNKQKLLKFCIILSIIGILTLLSISEFSQPKLYQIRDITKNQVDTQIKIEGKILTVKDLPGIALLNIQDNTSKMTVVAFKDFPIEELKKGLNVEITGKVAEYEHFLELIADEIKIKNDY